MRLVNASSSTGGGLSRAARALVLLAACGLLGGCNVVVMNPTGDIAIQQRNLIVASTALMMLVVVPVIVMAFVFAWRYRASNKEATYDPGFHHSTQLEVVIWTVPLLIIMAIGAMTWMATHTLDPFRPLGRIAPNRPVPEGVRPLEVQVVALDWKWLFIYPEYGVATVNELAAPVNRPILFRITSSSVWNTFFVPTLAGMIYAMPGMETRLNAVSNAEGESFGLSAHYSGTGFSRMNFRFRTLSPAGFEEWVGRARRSDDALDRDAFLRLERPSEAEPARFFGRVEAGLYDAILGLCVAPGQMCVTEMHHIDRAGGAHGGTSEENRRRLDYDNRRLRQGEEAPGATTPASGRPARSEQQPEGAMPREGQPSGSGPGPQGGGRPAPDQLTAPPARPHQH